MWLENKVKVQHYFIPTLSVSLPSPFWGSLIWGSDTLNIAVQGGWTGLAGAGLMSWVWFHVKKTTELSFYLHRGMCYAVLIDRCHHAWLYPGFSLVANSCSSPRSFAWCSLSVSLSLCPSLSDTVSLCSWPWTHNLLSLIPLGTKVSGWHHTWLFMCIWSPPQPISIAFHTCLYFPYR